MNSKKKILIERAEKIFQYHWLSFNDTKIKDVVPNIFLSIDREELLKSGMTVKRNKRWVFKPVGVKYVYRTFQNFLLDFRDALTNQFLEKEREIKEININVERLMVFAEVKDLQNLSMNIVRKKSPKIENLVASNQIYNLFREDF